MVFLPLKLPGRCPSCQLFSICFITLKILSKFTLIFKHYVKPCMSVPSFSSNSFICLTTSSLASAWRYFLCLVLIVFKIWLQQPQYSGVEPFYTSPPKSGVQLLVLPQPPLPIRWGIHPFSSLGPRSFPSPMRGQTFPTLELTSLLIKTHTPRSLTYYLSRSVLRIYIFSPRNDFPVEQLWKFSMWGKAL